MFYHPLFRDASLADDERRGGPSNFNDQALSAAVEEDDSLRKRMLAEDYNVDHSTTVCHLKKLGKVWKLPPHSLSYNNKVERVKIFTDLLLSSLGMKREALYRLLP